MSIQDKAKNALDVIKARESGEIQAAPSPKPTQLPPRQVEPTPSSGGDARSYPARETSDASLSSRASIGTIESYTQSRTPARGHSAPETRGKGDRDRHRRSRSPRPGQRKSSSTAVPPQSIAVRKESSKLQDRVPFSFRTPTPHNMHHDPFRRPAALISRIEERKAPYNGGCTVITT